MKKWGIRISFVSILSVSIFSQNVMAITLPDFGKMASETMSGIADAADQAGEAISGAADQAGKAVSDAAVQAGEAITEAADQMGKMASEAKENIGNAASGAIQQVGDFASGFASEAGKLASQWGNWAGKTADEVKDNLTKAGVSIQVTASELGRATTDKASELTEAAGNAANNAIVAVKGASDMVVDQAGHVVDLAAAGASYVSDAADSALKNLQDNGTVLMQIAQNAVADIDLSNEQNWDKAKEVVATAIEKAYDTGVIKEKNNRETVELITNIVFGTMMYTYQYSKGKITLGEYAGSMSEVIIREGLPTGVGFITDILPTGPISGDIAKEATYYLLAIAYEDDSGEEIEIQEEALLEEAIEAENEGLTEKDVDE